MCFVICFILYFIVIKGIWNMFFSFVINGCSFCVFGLLLIVIMYIWEFMFLIGWMDILSGVILDFWVCFFVVRSIRIFEDKGLVGFRRFVVLLRVWLIFLFFWVGVICLILFLKFLRDECLLNLIFVEGKFL